MQHCCVKALLPWSILIVKGYHQINCNPDGLLLAINDNNTVILQWRNYGVRARGRTCPTPNRGLCPRVPSPIQNFEKLGPHLRLQDTKCSSIYAP